MTERCLFATGGCVGALLIVAALLIALFARKQSGSMRHA